MAIVLIDARTTRALSRGSLIALISAAALAAAALAAKADDELPAAELPALELPGAEVPGYPACVRAIEPPAAKVSFEASEPATREAKRIVETLAAVRSSLRETRYEHATRVNIRRGSYLWDCSGMAAWVLDRAAPRAHAALSKGRPVARDFHRAIARAPLAHPRRGWQRLASIADGRPGDILAWLRAPGWRSTNTGHVAFLLERPTPIPNHPRAWAVRIADATSFGHQDDTRPAGTGGYGEGTLLVLTNAAEQPIAYGWYGTESDAVLVTDMVFGRVAR